MRKGEQICLLPLRLRAYKYQGIGSNGEGEGGWALVLGGCWIFAEGLLQSFMFQVGWILIGMVRKTRLYGG